jgi:exopolyphosphatase/guanosine-5'-triphosphate,3'-diphosphate pyrophosphatase
MNGSQWQQEESVPDDAGIEDHRGSPMTIAVIDIGTNTVLLLVAKIDGAGSITSLVYEQRVPRLGKGVDAEKNLQPESMERVVRVLMEYREIMSRYTIDAVVVAGTSAVRDAHNKQEFAKHVRQATGFDLEVLSGEDEAFWTYRGALSGVSGVLRATVIDIGGGSTEITTGSATSITNSISLNVGSVRLTERFFRHDPPTHPELEAAITFVEDELARPKGFAFEESSLIGVAGTATSLALLDQGLQEFSINAVENYRLRLDNVYALFRTLRAMHSSEILKLSTIMQGRNDVITAGALILREIMAHYKFSEMIVSERGVRYGLTIREWERRLKEQS